MICCNGIMKAYGNYRVLKGINATFADTGVYLLSGESGSGKTTFLNILYGLTSFDEGEVRVGDVSYSGHVDRRRMEKVTAYIPQDAMFVDFLSMRENLEMVNPDVSIIHRLCEIFDMNGLLQHFPKHLSGGERQRFAIIRALLFDRRILFMDEPTSAMDPVNKHKFMELMRELKDSRLIICASHDNALEEEMNGVIRFLK